MIEVIAMIYVAGILILFSMLIMDCFYRKSQ